ncbi:S-adenosyl-L-methionine-dependent methyltransferase [Conidiobolus coronatus NRRL 28638]|uniref:S-adenosyl-L-methionine-dependent methyltransferase n=1 Tax=Conidiobolus coronatus (strain ATCC 28846 / CBS 209.66 / NRRL 28638) TaxID=796925 RepID=A0A137NRD2_CONC2|nr:S-adenosyl-L-methionine-dependent methyltransferase [Conidiobolus coronatus NRRL 28638]|eukprot:KXN65295.1 S-adenosyl-L-methionine-dependent methyltransferase [Conidiobolus coronatus NRRL 28638]
MTESKAQYDDNEFFSEYQQMLRSKEGLKGAGEWHQLKEMLPKDFKGKRVLDLGCGYGWHCTYAIDQGAASVVGVDNSSKMLEKAREINNSANIEYVEATMETYNYPEAKFDIIISSLAFHYVENFQDLVNNINKSLVPGGHLVFSVEHPIFTAYGSGDWIYDSDNKPLHWPVDKYYSEGIRHPNFLGKTITKYHKTMTTYVNTLIQSGFNITNLVEATPHPDMVKFMPDELRRPMMLLVAAQKSA